MVQFVTVTAIFMLYYIMNALVVEFSFKSNVKSLLQHMKDTHTRGSLLKYYLDFLQEGFINLTPILSTTMVGSSLQAEYTQRIQNNDGVITASFKSNYPSQFEAYRTAFNNINYLSLCSHISSTTSSD